MSRTSQNVTDLASGNFHSLSKAPDALIVQIVKMTESNKNGGPNQLKAWREFRQLSQEQLAEKVETTASNISMLESGERGLSSKWLRKLAIALRTQPGHVLELDPNELDSDLIEIWINADIDQRRRLVDVAKALVKTGTNP